MPRTGEQAVESVHHIQPTAPCAQLSTSANLQLLYDQVGTLMAALVNNPKDVRYVRDTSARVYQTMVLLLRRCAEVGSQVVWIQTRVVYIRDVMEAAHACLHSRVSFETYLRQSRLHMDLCSRGGIKPTKPPGC